MIGAIRRREPRLAEIDGARHEAQQLAALVRECVTAGIARRACVVHLSRLAPDRVRPHHLRLARAALEPLAHADRARLFNLPNQSLVAIWRGPAEVALSQSRSAITHLFTDTDDLHLRDIGLWEEMELPDSAERLLAVAEDTLDHAGPAPSPKVQAPPLDPASLAALEAGLVQTDVARFARRRQICARLPDGGFELRWEKRFLSIEELAESLAPGHAPEADPWLFRRLTRTLDRRMLALLAAPGELLDAGPFSVNLNVTSILASEFLRFDAALPKALRERVTLDLLPADMLSDPAAFLFARDFARSRGYRLLLRGVTPDLLEVFPLGRIGLDLMQLRWSDQLTRCPVDAAFLDPSRVVLSHVDTAEALEWGSAQGIGLFQGRMAAAVFGGRTRRAGV